ncbi:alpha/beta fold hydrolase [Cellulosimicrobium sp. NPDC057127]|uniref:alpha/beta fold hydrolase n=1 Tax=Cellulosimicrobium sp. NPDC057127 TaxID=3346026 RepID=UPI003629A30A
MAEDRTPVVVLPGLALAPEDFTPLARAVAPDGDVRVLDAWCTPVTDPVDAVRDALGVDGASGVVLVGHSSGGLAALEWALLHPEEVVRLVLLDPESPFEPHLPGLHPGTPVARAGTAAAGALGRALAPAGTALRRAAVRLVARRADPLAAEVAAARYGDGRAWPLLADQWFASWPQSRRVRALLDDGLRLAPTTDALLVTGTRASARFLRSQRLLADRLGVPYVGLAGEGHLFPLTRPDVVGRLVAARSGAAPRRSPRDRAAWS